MRNKDIFLMAGSIAAGLQAASSKTQNPNMVILFVAVAAALAFYAEAPRNPLRRDRKQDKVDRVERD